HGGCHAEGEARGQLLQPLLVAAQGCRVELLALTTHVHFHHNEAILVDALQRAENLAACTWGAKTERQDNREQGGEQKLNWAAALLPAQSAPQAPLPCFPCLFV